MMSTLEELKPMIDQEQTAELEIPIHARNSQLIHLYRAPHSDDGYIVYVLSSLFTQPLTLARPTWDQALQELTEETRKSTAWTLL